MLLVSVGMMIYSVVGDFDLFHLIMNIAIFVALVCLSLLSSSSHRNHLHPTDDRPSQQLPVIISSYVLFMN